MTRFLPRSLPGQVILVMGVALLVALAVNLTVILHGQQQLSLAQNEGPAVTRFAATARQLVAARERDGDWRAVSVAAPEHSISRRSIVETMGVPRSEEREARLAQALAEAGVSVRAAHAAAFIETRQAPRHGHRMSGSETPHGQKIVLLSIQLRDGSWLNGRIEVATSHFWLVHRVLIATAIFNLIVLGFAGWAAIRIGRPMRDLASAAERFQGRDEAEPVEPRGPSDVRRAIHAFNAMNARVSALLDQKDRMLGAIGHDLRTPLASMRIRAENMEPDTERAQLFASIDDMAGMLEDILVLARTGRPREPVQRIDLTALADAVVEESRALGRNVSFKPSPRLVLMAQPNLLRRAVRNLVENACVHAEQAWVSVATAEDEIAIVIEDDGPGIPAEQLGEMLKPFRRLNSSRNRETGGAGLGLAIADAVAQAHGGRLELENRTEGGLRARIVLPRGRDQDCES